MSDLRESGSIEQDADVVMLLHREEYYHQNDEQWRADNPDKENLAELIVAKQRNGPTGTVRLTWDARTTRFNTRDESPGGFGTEVEWTPRPAAKPGAFPARPPTGPVDNHRDGGGPDRDSDEESPF
jgi:hypothetical protein